MYASGFNILLFSAVLSDVLMVAESLISLVNSFFLLSDEALLLFLTPYIAFEVASIGLLIKSGVFSLTTFSIF